MTLYSITPILICRDVQRTAQFYADFFGFKMTATFEPEGRLVWAELTNGEVRIMLGLAGQTHPILPNDHGTLSTQFYFEIDELEELHDRFVRASHRPSAIATRFYRKTEFEVSDPDGHWLVVSRESLPDETATPE